MLAEQSKTLEKENAEEVLVNNGPDFAQFSSKLNNNWTENVVQEQILEFYFRQCDIPGFEFLSVPYSIVGEKLPNGRFFVVSTACSEKKEKLSRIPELSNLKKQHELLLFIIQSDCSIELCQRLEFQNDPFFSMGFFPTHYTHLSLDFYADGCPILICFEGIGSAQRNSDLNLHNRNITDQPQSMRLDVFLIQEKKFKLSQRIQNFSQASITCSDHFDDSDFGEPGL